MSDALLERHFVPASRWGLLRRGHPQAFIETYQTQRVLYEDSSYYVNRGRSTEDAHTTQGGRIHDLLISARAGQP